MKFKVEIELEDLVQDNYEDGTEILSLESAVINEIAKKITQSNKNTIENETKKQIDNLISETVKLTIQTRINSIIDGYMENPVTISNGYKKEEYTFMYKMIEVKFGQTTNNRLDSSTCGSDKLLEKITNIIKRETTNNISNMTKLLEKEAKKIAAEEYKNNSLIQHLDSILKKD